MRLLSEAPEIYTIEETARDILVNHPELQEKKEFQSFLLEEQLRLEQEAEIKGFPIIVCDRGWIDVLVFSRYFGHQLDKEFLSRFKPYDGIFLCSPEEIIPTREDAIYQRPNERREIHRLTLEALQELGFDYQLLVGSREARFCQTLEIINQISGLEILQPNLWKERQNYVRKEVF